jgi:hypothetical protein
VKVKRRKVTVAATAAARGKAAACQARHNGASLNSERRDRTAMMPRCGD